MDVSNDFNFQFQLPIEKAEREDGWYIRGVAAGPEVDSQSERLAPSALQGFVQQIQSNPVPFLNWHRKDDVTAEIGEVSKAWLESDFKMGVEVKLDEDHPGAQYIWKKIDKGKQYGMSVAGRVNDYKDEYEKSTGGRVRTYYDVRLEEISLTTKPIYTPSFGTVLRKAADVANSEGDTSTMDVGTPNVAEEKATENSQVEAAAAPPASDAQVSEPETPVVEEKEVEKAVSPKTRKDAKTVKEIVKMHREMSRLIAELVLSDDDETPTTDSTAEAVATKAEETKPEDDRLEKAMTEIAELRGVVEQLREATPSMALPGALVSKSDKEELEELLKSLTPSDRLRFALKAQHGE